MIKKPQVIVPEVFYFLVHLFKSKAFDITLTLDAAIAAPATIGVRYPNAANGMPTKL